MHTHNSGLAVCHKLNVELNNKYRTIINGFSKSKIKSFANILDERWFRVVKSIELIFLNGERESQKFAQRKWIMLA